MHLIIIVRPTRRPWWAAPPLSRRWGKSQIPGTNDSTLHQLKPPRPSHVEGPVSPRRLGLATYPNPVHLALTIPCNEHIETTPHMIGARTSSTCLIRSGNPARERFAIKKPVRHSFRCPGRLYLTVTTSSVKQLSTGFSSSPLSPASLATLKWTTWALVLVSVPAFGEAKLRGG